MKHDNKITITFSTSEEKEKLLKLMPFFKPSPCGRGYLIDYAEMKLHEYNRENYCVDTTNSDARKQTAGEYAMKLQAQGLPLKKIAEQMTHDDRFFTSRGKKIFHSETVKRLIAEQHK